MSPVTSRPTLWCWRWSCAGLTCTLALLAGCATIEPKTLGSASTATTATKTSRAKPTVPEKSDVTETEFEPQPGPTAKADASAHAVPGSTTEPGSELTAVPQPNPWERLADAAQQLNCEKVDARTRRWIGQYTRQARALEADLQRAMPLIEMVSAELERRALPALFAMLPMVESQYYAPVAMGNRPAGIWQLMPQTARGLGVPMRSDYDGRLDYLRATEAAADLLAHLAAEFKGNWKLMNMAFNAGEFRVKSALRHHQGKHESPDALGLSKITLHHLARLEALTCLLSDPVAHGVTLPTVQARSSLIALPIDAPIATGFLAHLAGTELAVLRRWNPALRGEFTPDIDGLRVLLPAAHGVRAGAMLREIPAHTSRHWGMVRVTSEAERQRLLDLYRDDHKFVQAVNATSPGRDDMRLWLPIGLLRRHAAPNSDAPLSAEVHVIRKGDTLSHIAHRYRLAIKQLMHWNGLHTGSVLQPGQRIRISPR